MLRSIILKRRFSHILTIHKENQPAVDSLALHDKIIEEEKTTIKAAA
jgi:hypothetical protein